MFIHEFKVLKHLAANGNARKLWHVEVDLAGVCHHRCPFCFWADGAVSVGESFTADVKRIGFLRRETALSLIDDLADLGVEAVTFVGGGEPLLHPDAAEILGRAADRLRFGVITNLSGRHVAPLIQVLARAVWVRVSLDAARAETYAVMHNPRGGDENGWEQTCENFRALVAAAGATDVGASFVVTRENWREIADFARLVNGMGGRYVQFRPLYDVEACRWMDPLRGEIEALLKEAEAEAEPGRFDVMNHLFRVHDIRKENRRHTVCRIQHYGQIQISADGYVYPCCILKYNTRHAFGNLYERSFKEIWTSPERLRKAATFTADACPPCYYDAVNAALEAIEAPPSPHDLFV